MAYKTLSQILHGVSTFGRLTVVSEAPPKVAASGFEARCANVRCECGVEKVVRVGDLRNGDAASCGCLQKELLGEFSRRTRTTHGNAQKGKRTTEYVI